MQNSFKSNNILYYIHDPMCSWCWGFKPVLKQLTMKLPDSLTLRYLLGGLACDTNNVMPLQMQHNIQSTWKHIQQQIPGTQFNFDFWRLNIPRRSTYPSCRAVIAAENQQDNKSYEMIDAIQQAYYLDAKNPSDNNILIQLAEEIHLDIDLFKYELISEETTQELERQINFSRDMGASSFPSLYLFKDKIFHPVVLDYNDSDLILEHIDSILSS